VTDMSGMLEKGGIEACKDTIPESNIALAVKILSRWDEVELLRAEWTGILERNRKLTVFSTPEWLSAWWHAFGGNKQLYAVVFRDSQGVLVGLLPLYLQRIQIGLLPSLWRLRFVGDGSTDSDNLDFVVLPGYERAVARSFVQHLAADHRWDVCLLNVMPSDSLAANEFLREITLARWKFETSTVAWTSIELPETWEAYLQQLSAKERGKVANRTRRIEKRYQARFYKCSSTKELPACLETLFLLHQKRWELRGELGAFASSARRHFYYDMAEQFMPRGWLGLWMLELNGVAVAAQYGFRYGDTMYSLQEGFDPTYSADSVGYVLRSYALRKLIESGVRRYEFLAGQDESKLRWKCISGDYLNLHLARPGSRGSVYLSFARASKTSKSWIRGILPPSVVKFLNGFRSKSSPV
jgi:CelD/BcsL family acetyltransferase involved in cellulose biosynthesis